jgi:hypothetical protein
VLKYEPKSCPVHSLDDSELIARVANIAIAGKYKKLIKNIIDPVVL